MRREMKLGSKDYYYYYYYSDAKLRSFLTFVIYRLFSFTIDHFLFIIQLKDVKDYVKLLSEEKNVCNKIRRNDNNNRFS